LGQGRDDDQKYHEKRKHEQAGSLQAKSPLDFSSRRPGASKSEAERWVAGFEMDAAVSMHTLRHLPPNFGKLVLNEMGLAFPNWNGFLLVHAQGFRLHDALVFHPGFQR
jgi:hypothetical protein